MTTAATTWLDLAEPVDLETLEAEAALQTRTDRKYLLPLAEADRLLACVATRGRVLQIDGRREFGYASTYFDTPDLAAQHLTATRRRRRFKVRTRTYLDSGARWVEVKTRSGRGQTVKTRAPLASPDDGALAAADVTFVRESLAGAGVEADVRTLGPVLTTRYRRSTLQHAGARVTVDTLVTWQGNDGTVLCVPDLAVLETKSGSSVSDVDRLLWAGGHRPRPLSKYGTGLALLRPELPANRWHRTLVRLTAHAGDGPGA